MKGCQKETALKVTVHNPNTFHFNWFDVLSSKKIMPEVVDDELARRLETAGFWRRASARWLMLMSCSEYTESQREWIVQRRTFCLTQIRSPVLPEKFDIREISRAADKTLQMMGIASPAGEVFRSSVRKQSFAENLDMAQIR